MENLISKEMLQKSDILINSKLFTKMQISIFKKKLSNKKLNSNELTYYYKFIKPKMLAMANFFGIYNYNISGSEYILYERLKKSFELIKKLEQKYKNKKILIAGSYLYSQKYNDIDVFILTKYKKQDIKLKGMHISFIQDENTLFFNSISKISVSNYKLENKEILPIQLEKILLDFEMLINSINNNEDYKSLLRTFILELEYVSNGQVLNSKQLTIITNKLISQNIKLFSNMMINSLVLAFNKDELKNKLNDQIINYNRLLNEYKNNNTLKVFIDTYSKVIDFES